MAPERKVALVVGLYGAGSAIATELAKSMDVVITYRKNVEAAERLAHQIQAQKDVRRLFPTGIRRIVLVDFSCKVPSKNKLKLVKFVPKLEVGSHGEASKTLVKDALGKLTAEKLDVVVSLLLD